jgi:transcriptional regulator with XRE-family HTH domain
MEAKDIIADLLARGMTQVEIAEGAGMRQPTVSKVLNGKVSDVLSVNYRRLLALHKQKAREKRRAA